MEVKILGTGCAKCKKLHEATERAAQEAGVQAEIVKIEKLEEIIAHGVAVTPGLVIAGEVKSSGRIPDVKQITGWLKEAAAKS